MVTNADGFSTSGEFQVLLQTFGACSQALITMSYDHHASLRSRHWSFQFLCAVAVVISMFWSDAVYQCVHFRKLLRSCLPVHHSSLVSHLYLTCVSPKRLFAGLPSAVPDDWPGGGIICFPQSGGWVRVLLGFTFLFFVHQVVRY